LIVNPYPPSITLTFNFYLLTPTIILPYLRGYDQCLIMYSSNIYDNIGHIPLIFNFCIYYVNADIN